MRIFGVPAAIVHKQYTQFCNRVAARILRPLMIAGALFAPMLAAERGECANSGPAMVHRTSSALPSAYRAEEGWITGGWWQVPGRAPAPH